MCALLQSFRYDQSLKQHRDPYRGKMKECYSFFFNVFFIPVMSSICVFYLIGNKTWIRCKLGARCMKREDILN